MDWRSNASLPMLKQRADLMRQVRQFFYDRKVLEVDTPLLCRRGVTDPHLENLTTSLSAGPDGKAVLLHLQTSPEFAMKRLLAQHKTCIYQLSHVFRDDEVGRYHNPEFTLLEWYRIGYSLVDLIREVGELLCDVVAAPKISTLTYQQAFFQHTGCDPLTPAGVRELHELLKQRSDTQAWMAQESDTDTILQVAFNLLVEPALPLDRPIAVTHFPRSQAALARLCPDDDRVALRFEIYYRGIELANGYDELTDAAQQQQRFAEDNARRLAMNKPERQADEQLLAALQSGLPECSGVALGFDRLLMIASDASHIADLQPFSISNC